MRRTFFTAVGTILGLVMLVSFKSHGGHPTNLSALGAVGTPYSRISFTQPSRPAVLSGQAEEDGEADTSYRYVLMPVRFAS